jgi:pyruvate/2-oxoglutarate dehydrogenase complex dihydrolipoamide dehydrogenase (E3) component
MIGRAPIEVRLKATVAAEVAEGVAADVIIAALGGRPLIPAIPGIEGGNVLGAEDAYRHPEKTGATVLVLGGGLAGIELAIFLSSLGRTVTVMEMMETLSDGGNPVHGLALINEIKRYAIQVTTSTRAAEITARGVVGEYVGNLYTLPPCPTVQAAVLQSNSFGRVVRAEAEVGSRKLFEVDTVIYATGREPLHPEADALRFCAPAFYQIGDCLTPRNMLEATRMAFAVARDL